MKRKIIAFLLVAIVMMSVQVLADEPILNISFDNDTNMISVQVNYAEYSKFTLSMSPHYDFTPSKNTPPVYIYFYETNSEGEFEKSIPVNVDLPSGKYDVRVISTQYTLAKSFIYVNCEDVGTLDVINAINNAEDAEDICNVLSVPSDAAKVGIDAEAEDFIENLSFVCEYIFDEKQGLYTYETFSGKYDDAIEARQLVQDIKNSETSGNIREIIELKSDFIGVDLKGDFRKIHNQHKVYSKMFDIRNDFDSIQSIRKAFNEFVEEVLDDEEEDAPVKKPTSSKGGSGGGGSVIMPSVNKQQNSPAPDAGNGIQDKVYSDVEGHFSKDSVYFLTSKNIISGYPDGSFCPDNYVTRAEFAKIAALAFGIDPVTTTKFSDVSGNEWYAGYVGALSELEILNGYNGMFNPDLLITRQDAACIVYRILSLKSVAFGNETESFDDYENISEYAKDAVSALKASLVIKGSNNIFNPHSNITRGESAVLIHNALSFIQGGK